MLQKILMPEVDLESLTALDKEGFEIISIREVRFRNHPSGVGDLLSKLPHEVLVKGNPIPAHVQTRVRVQAGDYWEVVGGALRLIQHNSVTIHQAHMTAYVDEGHRSPFSDMH
jgi:hypothetical protein